MKKSVAPFVLGLIGGIVGLVDGLCLSVCAEIADALEVTENLTLYVWIFLIGGSVIGLVGASISLSKNKTGGILLIIAALFPVIFMVILQDFIYFQVVIIALFAIGGILDLTAKNKAVE